MKTKQAVGNKKQSIIVKDLKTRKNPKGGAETVGLFLKGHDTDIKGDSTQAARGKV